jgi:hypothetical protein
VDPVPDLLLFRQSGSAVNRTRDCGSAARNSDHLITEALYPGIEIALNLSFYCALRKIITLKYFFCCQDRADAAAVESSPLSVVRVNGLKPQSSVCAGSVRQETFST